TTLLGTRDACLTPVRHQWQAERLPYNNGRNRRKSWFSSSPMKRSYTSPSSRRISFRAMLAQEKNHHHSARLAMENGLARKSKLRLPFSITPAKCSLSRLSAKCGPATHSRPTRNG